MFNLQQYIDLKRKELPNVKKGKSERGDIIKELYDYYRLSNKQQNWKRYVNWLKKNRFVHSNLKIEEFKKSNECLKARVIKSFAIMLAHIPTTDLYYLVSIAKDKKNRKENFSGWLMGELYKKGD